MTLLDNSVYLDFYDLARKENPNITILGKGGSGKMYHNEKRKQPKAEEELLFENLPQVGDLKLEKVFYEYNGEPILFVCLDTHGIRYLCSCCRLSEMWLITQVSIEQLIDMMDDKIYLRDMFQIGIEPLLVKWDGETITSSCEIPKEAYPQANVFLDLAKEPDVVGYRKKLIRKKNL